MLDDLSLSPPVPSWNDLFLRFPSQNAANAALLAAGLLIETMALVDAEDNILQPAGYAPVNASIDSIGVIYKPTGKTIITDEGEQPEMAPLPGWHVNVRLSADKTCPNGLKGFIVAPSSPVRVWA